MQQKLQNLAQEMLTYDTIWRLNNQKFFTCFAIDNIGTSKIPKNKGHVKQQSDYKFVRKQQKKKLSNWFIYKNITQILQWLIRTKGSSDEVRRNQRV